MWKGRESNVVLGRATASKGAREPEEEEEEEEGTLAALRHSLPQSAPAGEVGAPTLAAVVSQRVRLVRNFGPRRTGEFALVNWRYFIRAPPPLSAFSRQVALGRTLCLQPRRVFEAA